MKFARTRANKSRARTLIAESQNLISASRDLHTDAERLKGESAQLVRAGKRLYAHFYSIRQEQGSTANHEGPGIAADTQGMMIGGQLALV